MNKLLIPRYTLIADYPGNFLGIGSIIVCNSFDSNYMTEWCDFHDKYPHLFQKVEWYEYRHILEMPTFLKDINTGIVEKAIKIPHQNYKYYLPSTEMDFIEQESV